MNGIARRIRGILSIGRRERSEGPAWADDRKDTPDTGIALRVLSILCALAWGLCLHPAALFAVQNIGGLGRITPQGDVVRLAGPPGEVIDSVYVAAGDAVKAGAPLVAFKSRTMRRLELDMARLALREAKESTRMAVEAQKQKVSLLAYQADLAKKRLARVEEAGGASFSPRQMEEASEALFTAENALSVARLELEKMTLDRTLNVERATRQVELAGEKLRMATLTATRQGTVLEVHARPGEAVDGAPIVVMADLSQMYVVCDIFEGDLRRIAKGMRATVTSHSLPETLQGVVESVGMVIDERSQMGKVTIRLLNAAPVARLIHMQVNVAIHAP
jgi:HlyD family secretion protein